MFWWLVKNVFGIGLALWDFEFMTAVFLKTWPRPCFSLLELVYSGTFHKETKHLVYISKMRDNENKSRGQLWPFMCSVFGQVLPIGSWACSSLLYFSCFFSIKQPNQTKQKSQMKDNYLNPTYKNMAFKALIFL